MPKASAGYLGLIMPLVELIPLRNCRPGGGVFVQRGGRKLAVFLLSDSKRVFVIDDTCPHAGWSLSGGQVDGTVVRCPYHYWAFDLRSGACEHSRLARVRPYPAEVRDGVVWADLPEKPD